MRVSLKIVTGKLVRVAGNYFCRSGKSIPGAGTEAETQVCTNLYKAFKQRTDRWLNNRAENSHQPFRRRERAMLRFRRVRSLQKLVAVQSAVYNHFNQERHLYSREIYKLNRAAALAE